MSGVFILELDFLGKMVCFGSVFLDVCVCVSWDGGILCLDGRSVIF